MIVVPQKKEIAAHHDFALLIGTDELGEKVLSIDRRGHSDWFSSRFASLILLKYLPLHPREPPFRRQ